MDDCAFGPGPGPIV